MGEALADAPQYLRDGIEECVEIMKKAGATLEQTYEYIMGALAICTDSLDDRVLAVRCARELIDLACNPPVRHKLQSTDYTGFDQPVYQRRVGKARILYLLEDGKIKPIKIGMVKDLYPAGSPARQAHR